jgi:hypothetical protein
LKNPSLRVEEQKNYYVEVLRPSSRYSTFRQTKTPKGFILRYGKKKRSSKWELQAILHPKFERTKSQVRAKARKRVVRNPYDVTYFKKRGMRETDPVKVTSGPHTVETIQEAATLVNAKLPEELVEIKYRPNPDVESQELTPKEIKRLEKIYEEFHFTGPTEVIEISAEDAPDGTPDVLGVLGTAVGVSYRVDDPNSAKKGDPWYHEFDEVAPGKFRKKEQKPLLCYDKRGRLHIVGGNYKVTRRGIVG